MKKTSATNRSAAVHNELQKEYRFNYTMAKPNRFAGQPDEPRVVVVLDPEVAKVFETRDSVNEVLRALIKTMPRPGRTAPKSRRARTSA